MNTRTSFMFVPSVNTPRNGWNYFLEQVYENQNNFGTICELYKARGRGRLLDCSLCKEPGATVDCSSQKCEEVYHYEVLNGCLDNTVGEEWKRGWMERVLRTTG